MEAALCPGYGPMPCISLRIPPTTFTKLRFGFNCPFPVSNGFMMNHRPRHRFYTPGPLALDRSNSSKPSENEKGCAKVVRGAVGVSLALACSLSIIGCGCKMNFKAMAGPKQQIYQKAPSFQQIAPPAPRKMALKSLLDVTVSLSSKEGRRVRDISPGSHFSGPRHSVPSKDQIDQLKKEAVSLMKRGLPEEALYMLKNEYKKYEMSEPESAYYMNMVLVEIMISQGKYEEAYEFMNSHDQKISDFDVRPTLYKAILCTMLDKGEEAQNLWEDFASSFGF
ncbi:Detected protein of unknown function [Hibiscus syriacus]|uniref:Uncharacterized protein n=1 Tax=Hibiscus syriacus TaxID=106335 RepID=A0A6A3AZD2_HIBSY|nr:uncharacterized protein LOC120119246 [Hibiscus syriacus]KAE8708847.1 Detected protein of unknown function [Hibiscus syriacus]